VWFSRPDRLLIGLGEVDCCVKQGDRTESFPWTIADLDDALAQRVDVGRSTDCSFMLSSFVCRHFVHQAPLGLRSFAELRLAASVRAASLFGGQPRDWVTTADWQLDSPYIVAAVPGALAQVLNGIGRAKSVCIQSSVLYALKRLSQGHPDAQVFAWETPGAIVAAFCDQTSWVGLRNIRKGVSMDAPSVMAILAREVRQERLRGGLSTPTTAVVWAGRGDPDCTGNEPTWLDAGWAMPAVEEDDTEAQWLVRLADMQVERPVL
jgi:hypothetical protein